LTNVLAVHKLTGIIAEVPEIYLDIYPELTKATDKQLKAAKDAEETRIYGAPLKNGIIPGDVVLDPQGEPAGLDAVNKTEGGTANG
jgi:hypothetical protein